MSDKQQMPAQLGRYRVVRELGKGAMGIVYEGEDPNIGRRVAIKTARRDVLEASGRAEEMMQRFLREAQAAGTLNHPNIITIYDAGEEGGTAFIAMEFLEGNDLQKAIDQRQRFTPEDIVRITATICRALGHAHEAGVVHRDVKPSNVILLPDGRVKVADFGIAHVSDSNLTQEGAMIGTPHYMSPEQFMGQRIDGRSDLFSAGVIVYEMLTGEKPFPGEALSTVMHSVIRVEPIPPRELNFAVTDCLSRIIMKALRKDPRERYQSGEEMARALEEALKDAPDPAITKVDDTQDAGEATVVGDLPAGEATVLSGTSPGSGATVVTPPPTRAPDAATAPDGGKQKFNPKLLAAIGGAAAVLLVAYGVITALGNGDPTGGPPAGTPATPETANAGTATAEPVNYIGEIIFEVWEADNAVDYAMYTDSEDMSLVDIADGATVTVVDPATNEQLFTGRFPESIDFKPEKKYDKLKIIASKEGYVESEQTIDATSPAALCDLSALEPGYHLVIYPRGAS